MIKIKKYVWTFYKNNELIEKYNNVIKSNNIFKINDKLRLIKKDNRYILERETLEYTIIIDFLDKICTINLLKENLFTKINLLETEIVDKADNITIIYKLDEDEINKLVINLEE